MELDSYTLVILRRGEAAGTHSEAELEELQAAHLAHLSAMREQGHLLVAGPFRDQDDDTFRGMCLYALPLAEARSLAESDPAVRAGRMRVEALTWLTQKGALAFPA